MSCGGGGEKAAKEVRVSAKGRGSATEVGSPSSFGWDLQARKWYCGGFLTSNCWIFLVERYFGEPVEI